MKALCRIGLHSWEVVQAISGREISEGLFDLETTNLLCLSDDPDRWRLFHSIHQDRICRFCGCTSEDIEPAIRGILQAGKEEKVEHDKRVWARHAARERVRKIRREINT
jgi:hypothetical protein